MSVKAHRILKVEYAPQVSFNLYGDQKLVEFLENENDLGFYRQMNDNGGGVVTVGIKTIQKAIDEAEELELDEDTVKVLGEDIAAAKAENNETIDYDCF